MRFKKLYRKIKELYNVKNLVFIAILFFIIGSLVFIFIDKDAETNEPFLTIFNYELKLYEGRRGNIYFDIFAKDTGERIVHKVIVQYKKENQINED